MSMYCISSQWYASSSYLNLQREQAPARQAPARPPCVAPVLPHSPRLRVGAPSCRRRQCPAQQRHRLLERLDKYVHLLPRVINVQARPRRRRDAQFAMQRLRAVVPGAHGDALQVEHSRQVAAVHAVDVERAQGCARAARPVHAHLLQRCQPLVQVLGKLRLVCVHALHAEPL
ncbi:unnamed protein product [Chondrus crispus]|uniref:Uncharacterized protein n=1 Tax=Chondrus crispus TaxID=2769 RepID=R7QRU7_CHOCR|nr:unnamed protein product [Chondrus crispus]CDF40080.1 unnamed protein product [Chondrus crispus]|eukprot:XP_005710374.1 unnamed protein product [Chondrus crispus]